MKEMAAWVLARCCSAGKGGMVTKGLGNTIDSITDTSSKFFPDPALRKMVTPTDTTILLTLVISSK